MNKIRLGINGFGRIGRLLLRQLISNQYFEIIFINDKVEAIENFVYLYNYDSAYGRPESPMKFLSSNLVMVKEKKVDFYHHENLQQLLATSKEIDILIDCSGSEKNINEAHKVTKAGKLKSYICTLPICADVDKFIVFGLNHQDFGKDQHKVISLGSCDSNAISHFINLIDQQLEITGGSVLTLHPAMAYQGIQDSIINTQKGSQQREDFMALGRSASPSIIPKGTTTLKSVSSALNKNYNESMMAMSYRVPTISVTSAHLNFQVKREISNSDFRELIRTFAQGKEFLNLEEDYLVSIDYLKTSYSAIIDHKWTEAKNNILRLVLWYDNEWGYCSRVTDFLDFIYHQQ
jgi:glyceraldehyde 3-phosphate dehydrogenase